MTLLLIFIAVTFVLCMQLKAVVVEISQQPHVLFVAAKTIEVGDELLFDYNDNQSRLEFLRRCPVCQEQGRTTGYKRHISSEDMPVTKRPTMEISTDTANQTNSPVSHAQDDATPDDSQNDTTIQPAEAMITPSTSTATSRRQTTKAKKTYDIETLAKAEELDKQDRAKLFAAVSRQFPVSMHVTRAMLQNWQPSISDNNVTYILSRRNKETILRLHRN